jgi:hypothetical protein
MNKKATFLPRFFAWSAIAVTFVATLNTAGAQLLPSVFSNFFRDDVVDVAFNRVQMFFLLLLGGFLVLIVFYIIRGLQKFASKDNSGDMSEATQIMQRNMIAIGGVFIGVIGVAVVLIFFGINPNQITPHQICIDSPDGFGCFACTEKPSRSSDKDKFSDVCDMCNQRNDFALGSSRDVPGGEALCNTGIPKGVLKKDIEELIRGASLDR